VKLAFSVTINKSQGQEFEKVGLDLRTQVFQHGQLYVAFSRAKSWNGITVQLSPENIDRTIKNIVYKEIL
jgi:ATP-dependent exoDNAse (exonuclease V) alpha subunit